MRNIYIIIFLVIILIWLFKVEYFDENTPIISPTPNNEIPVISPSSNEISYDKLTIKELNVKENVNVLNHLEVGEVIGVNEIEPIEYLIIEQPKSITSGKTVVNGSEISGIVLQGKKGEEKIYWLEYIDSNGNLVYANKIGGEVNEGEYNNKTMWKP